MNPILTNQRTNLMLALACLNTVETCDEKIKVGNHANYYKGVRADAINQFTEAVASLCEKAISKVALEYEAS